MHTIEQKALTERNHKSAFTIGTGDPNLGVTNPPQVKEMTKAQKIIRPPVGRVGKLPASSHGVGYMVARTQLGVAGTQF